MAKKSVAIAHPRAVVTPDDWVNRKPEPDKPAEQMIRLSVDLPESLHTKLKMQCVARRQKMADAVRGLIERHVAAEAA
jgi:hypothetical protein